MSRLSAFKGPGSASSSWVSPRHGRLRFWRAPSTEREVAQQGDRDPLEDWRKTSEGTRALDQVCLHGDDRGCPDLRRRAGGDDACHGPRGCLRPCPAGPSDAALAGTTQATPRGPACVRRACWHEDRRCPPTASTESAQLARSRQGMRTPMASGDKSTARRWRSSMSSSRLPQRPVRPRVPCRCSTP
jgi:hypothetical protein